MATSNAERQRLYMRRTKWRASLDAVGEQTQRAVDRALAQLWGFYDRAVRNAECFGLPAGLQTYESFVDQVRLLPGGVVGVCRVFADAPDAWDVSPQQRAACQTIVSAATALGLDSGPE